MTSGSRDHDDPERQIAKLTANLATVEHTLDLVRTIIRLAVRESAEPNDFSRAIFVASAKVLAEAANIEPRHDLPYDVQAKAMRESEKNITQIVDDVLTELRNIADPPIGPDS